MAGFFLLARHGWAIGVRLPTEVGEWRLRPKQSQDISDNDLGSNRSMVAGGNL